MKNEFPIRLLARFVGQAGSSGSFTDDKTGEKIEFASAIGFDFDSAEGNVQRLAVRENRILEVAESGFDLDKLRRYEDFVQIEGNAVINSEGKSFFKLIRIGKAPKASAVAA